MAFSRRMAFPAIYCLPAAFATPVSLTASPRPTTTKTFAGVSSPRMPHPHPHTPAVLPSQTHVCTAARRDWTRKRRRNRASRTPKSAPPAYDRWEDRVTPVSPTTTTTTTSSSDVGGDVSTIHANSQGRSTATAPPPPRRNDLRPESCPALVLNADFSPLSYMPLSLWPWQEVIKAVFLNRVTVVATYDIGIRSPGMIFPLPSVVSLKEYQPLAKRAPAFTRFNVFLRDGFACQYCGRRFATQELTFDHVVPRCSGGKTNWVNVVTACVGCNHTKGRKLLKDLPGFHLKKPPACPTNTQLQANARNFPPRYLHESWRDYVYWSQRMEVEREDDDDDRTDPAAKGATGGVFDRSQ